MPITLISINVKKRSLRRKKKNRLKDIDLLMCEYTSDMPEISSVEMR